MNDEMRALALWCKRKELEKLGHAHEENEIQYAFFEAQGEAFSQVWERIVFDGKSVPDGTVSPMEYNRQNEIWGQLAAGDTDHEYDRRDPLIAHIDSEFQNTFADLDFTVLLGEIFGLPDSDDEAE